MCSLHGYRISCVHKLGQVKSDSKEEVSDGD
jgi:hypothetical protein